MSGLSDLPEVSALPKKLFPSSTGVAPGPIADQLRHIGKIPVQLFPPFYLIEDPNRRLLPGTRGSILIN